MKRIILCIAFISVFGNSTGVIAGALDSSYLPNDVQSAMFTLEDIYQRLLNGADGTKRIGPFAEPTGAPIGTGHSLNDVMTIAPSIDDTNGATASHVLNGKKFWGLTSSGWGLQTGLGDSNLIPVNILNGIIIFGVTGNYPDAVVEKTGQTTSYDANTPKRDDGGVVPGKSWPNPRFTKHNNGTVTDNLTGLIWLENTSCPGLRYWQDALDDIVSLNTHGTMNVNNCGDTSNSGNNQTDWRLPTIKELLSLIHYGFNSPCLPNTAGTGRWTADNPFINVSTGGSYWSSTTLPNSPSNAYTVSLSNAGVGTGTIKTEHTCNVWPVRGGQQ